MKPYQSHQSQAWLKWPPGIPKDKALREANNKRWEADLERPKTPEEDAEDARRIAEKWAMDHGLSGLFGQ